MVADKKVYAFIHHEFVPLTEAYLHISDLAIQRGYGIFDYFWIQRGQPLFFEDYLDRFYQSAGLMQLPVPLERRALREKALELIRLNNFPLSGMKLLLTGGYSESGYEPGTPNLVLIEQAVAYPEQENVEKGIKIITHEYQRELPAAKTINYNMGIRLIGQIKEKGAQDVLYHQNGIVTEFPRSNFFIVKQDNTIATPAREVLKGITRKNVLDLAAATYATEEGNITFEDVQQAKEAFQTSTTKRIVPIVQINDTLIGTGKPGSVTLALLQQLEALEQQYIDQTK
ncbi:amino acid aminotransferase [Pontibacter qinzhouensis]|uniref:branched-chain-amino-acid transaminase n=1 Tax=Pontibacter qinzhouensis TaxID=2603253 RepID=A0A5C8K7Y3_9BACT|nr:aminotransferase class IV [Pontibacter qinzhouensis]TXK45754.1 amino acid aminotransferase [Pontibacter qinzhouensis]